MKIFEWVRFKLNQVFRISENIKEPTQLFLAIGAPQQLIKLFESIEDFEYPLKKCSDGDVPDLESRSKIIKKKNGQFYTPENLANRIVKEISLVEERNNLEILDPACGDGSFLMAAAQNYKLDNLHGYDIDIYALLVCAVRLICAFPEKGWPKLEKRDFLLERPHKKFDVIIGNPPYKVNLAEDLKDRLQQMYETAEGEKDLYTFFLEASIKSLKPDGIMAMLTSHTWLINHQCLKIRKYIFEDHKVESLFMLPARFFVLAPTVLPVVALIKNQKETKDYNVKINSDYSDVESWLSVSYAMSDELVEGTGLRNSIVPPTLRPIFTSMSCNYSVLGEVTKIGVGIQESLKKDGASSKFVSDVAISENYKPVLRGREVTAFKVDWEGKYIHFGPHLAFGGDENIYKKPKILYQNIRNEKLKIRLVATVDDKGYYPKNSLSYIVSLNKNYSLNFLTGILNSLLVNGWFSSQNHSFHVTVTQVKKIPIPNYDSKLFRAVERIVEKLQQSNTEEDFITLKQKLDKAVIKCYFPELKKASNLCEVLDAFLERATKL